MRAGPEVCESESVRPSTHEEEMGNEVDERDGERSAPALLAELLHMQQ